MKAVHISKNTALLTVGMLLLAALASAENYPAKPVRIVTGGAGTFHDVVTRQLGQRLTERWSQPVVVENQPAAAGAGRVSWLRR